MLSMKPGMYGCSSGTVVFDVNGVSVACTDTWCGFVILLFFSYLLSILSSFFWSSYPLDYEATLACLLLYSTLLLKFQLPIVKLEIRVMYHDNSTFAWHAQVQLKASTSPFICSALLGATPRHERHRKVQPLRRNSPCTLLLPVLLHARRRRR